MALISLNRRLSVLLFLFSLLSRHRRHRHCHYCYCHLLNKEIICRTTLFKKWFFSLNISCAVISSSLNSHVYLHASTTHILRRYLIIIIVRESMGWQTSIRFMQRDNSAVIVLVYRVSLCMWTEKKHRIAIRDNFSSLEVQVNENQVNLIDK